MDAHSCKFHCDLGRVVIAKNSKDATSSADGAEDKSNPRIDLVASAEDFEAVVACHYANIDGQRTHDLSGSLGQPVNSVNVEIRQMQNTKTLERSWQGAELEAQRAENRLPGGIQTGLVQA